MKKGLFWLKIIIVLAFIGLTSYLVSVILNLNMLPAKFFSLVVGYLVSINILASILLLRPGKIKKIISVILYLLLLIVCIMGIKYGQDTIDFLNKGFNNNLVETTNFNIYVAKDSEYQELKELKDKSLGYLIKQDDLDEVLSLVNERISMASIGYEDFYDLYSALLSHEVDAILLDDVYLDILSEEILNIEEEIKSVEQFTVNKKLATKNEVVIKELKPFNIYISGSDSRNALISNKSRSDVNMIVTVNPLTKTILMTTIPRDYYVSLHGKTGLKDKLTHSGIYGLEVSKMTVEDLFDVKIDYSVKVGMNAVVELVDLVGGIEVYSDTEFDSYHIPGWHVAKGLVQMDGAHALAYARERYAYRTGDRHRILNQQQVLEATLKKALTNKDLLLKYAKILDSLSDLYRTDIPRELISLLVKSQLNDMSTWQFTSQTVSGSDAHMNTYSAPSSNAYVMIPYERDVTRAHEKITEILTDS